MVVVTAEVHYRLASTNEHTYVGPLKVVLDIYMPCGMDGWYKYIYIYMHVFFCFYSDFYDGVVCDGRRGKASWGPF